MDSDEKMYLSCGEKFSFHIPANYFIRSANQQMYKLLLVYNIGLIL